MSTMAFGKPPGTGALIKVERDGQTPAPPSEEIAYAPPPSLQLPAGTKIGGRYEVVRQLGEGGMGAVYEARHVAIGRSVAVKVLRSELAVDANIASRFLQEARAANEVRHRNIVEILDFGSDEGRLFLVMEYLRGESLQSLLDREAPLAAGRIIHVLDPILRALALAHERGIVHRDVKPDNIYLAVDDEGGEPVPKLLDFGIAKRFESNDMKLTATGITMGTPAYMAPEQAAGERALSGAVDQYAIGAILYEALTGHVPHEADTYNAMIIMRATSPAARLDSFCPDLDADLVEVIMRALALRPDQRFGSMHELRKALAPFAAMTEKAGSASRVVNRHGRTVRDGSPVVAETVAAPSLAAIPASVPLSSGQSATPPIGSAAAASQPRAVRPSVDPSCAETLAAESSSQLQAMTAKALAEASARITAAGHAQGGGAAPMPAAATPPTRIEGGNVAAPATARAPATAKNPTPAHVVAVSRESDIDVMATTPMASSVGDILRKAPRNVDPEPLQLRSAKPSSRSADDFPAMRSASSGAGRIPRSRTPWLLVAGGGIATAIVLALVLRAPPGTSTSPTTLTRPNEAQAATDRVTFTFDFEPASAEITLDDVRLGAGHAAVTRPRDGRRYQLRVTAPGHQPFTEVVTADANARIASRLASVIAAPLPSSSLGVPTSAIATGRATPPTTRQGSRPTAVTPTPGTVAPTAVNAQPAGTTGSGESAGPAPTTPTLPRVRPHVRPNIDRENPFGS